MLNTARLESWLASSSIIDFWTVSPNSKCQKSVWKSSNLRAVRALKAAYLIFVKLIPSNLLVLCSHEIKYATYFYVYLLLEQQCEETNAFSRRFLTLTPLRTVIETVLSFVRNQQWIDILDILLREYILNQTPNKQPSSLSWVSFSWAAKG